MSKKRSARYAAARELRILNGTFRPDVDPQPCTEHIQTLRAQGMSLDTIAALTSLAVSTIQAIGEPRSSRARSRLRPETADAILSAKFDLDRIPGHRLIPAAGTQRRLMALAAMGWSYKWVADRLGTPFTNISRLGRNDGGKVTARRARDIRDLYRTHAHLEGPSAVCAHRSRLKGWATCAAWDDDNIDDPAAAPIGVGQSKASAAEQIAELVELGVSVHDIAKRRHTTVEAVERALQRHQQRSAA
jgi:hypothetical protein